MRNQSLQPIQPREINLVVPRFGGHSKNRLNRLQVLITNRNLFLQPIQPITTSQVKQAKSVVSADVHLKDIYLFIGWMAVVTISKNYFVSSSSYNCFTIFTFTLRTSPSFYVRVLSPFSIKRVCVTVVICTSKSLSEAPIFASINPQYDNRFFMELP